MYTTANIEGEFVWNVREFQADEFMRRFEVGPLCSPVIHHLSEKTILFIECFSVKKKCLILNI